MRAEDILRKVDAAGAGAAPPPAPSLKAVMNQMDKYAVLVSALALRPGPGATPEQLADLAANLYAAAEHLAGEVLKRLEVSDVPQTAWARHVMIRAVLNPIVADWVRDGRIDPDRWVSVYESFGQSRSQLADTARAESVHSDACALQMTRMSAYCDLMLEIEANPLGPLPANEVFTRLTALLEDVADRASGHVLTENESPRDRRILAQCMIVNGARILNAVYKSEALQLNSDAGNAEAEKALGRIILGFGRLFKTVALESRKYLRTYLERAHAPSV